MTCPCRRSPVAAMRRLLVPLAMLAPLSVQGAPLPPAGVFVYTNACASPGGDFEGFRVTLKRSASGMTARIQFSDDGPDGDDQARHLRFDPKSGRLGFGFRGGESGAHTFTGTVSREVLKGRFDTVVFTLPLLRRVPRELPDC